MFAIAQRLAIFLPCASGLRSAADQLALDSPLPVHGDRPRPGRIDHLVDQRDLDPAQLQPVLAVVVDRVPREHAKMLLDGGSFLETGDPLAQIPTIETSHGHRGPSHRECRLPMR